ncbi:MAG: NifB/NifX family molybdenum-iron cluster-binding protein [Thermodesulfobacteriota bacterium]|nr:NifB/NifX family molybdenum-iron cluster-binding protein [Thermodesulfobacteriota bacterium]
MKVGFAVQKDEGIESQVYNHFGSAPAFILVDAETKETVTVPNRDLQHVHGMCEPVSALGGKEVCAVVVGGIGPGALMKLNTMGVRVYEAGARTVKENLQLLRENRLQELSMSGCCKGHQGGCSH